MQLRSHKTAWFWMAYMLVLVAVAVTTYSSIASIPQISLVDVQERLTGYYTALMAVLQTMVLLVSPVLAASLIVNEYDRRSMDLVMSAPVSPKYFLVGKLIAGVRQLFMLLFLSLPVTAVGVTMGGSSWIDVLEHYAYLLMMGTIVMALAMPIAVGSKKMANTVITSYASIMVLTLFGALTSAISGGIGMRMMPTGSGLKEMPFFSGLIPYFSQQALGSVTMIGVTPVSNVWIALLATLVMTKVMVLGAGSSLAPRLSPELFGLRIHLVVLAAIVGLLAAAGVSPMFSSLAPGPGISGYASTSPQGMENVSPVAGFVSAWFIPLLFALTVVSTYSYSDGVKYAPVGWLNVRQLFRGGPAAGLPYTLCLVLLIAGPMTISAVLPGAISAFGGFTIILWTLAFFWVMWGLCWLASGMSKSIVNARRGATAFLVGINVMVNAFFGVGAIFVAGVSGSQKVSLPDYNPFVPVGPDVRYQFCKALVLFVLGLLIWRLAENMRKKKALALEIV